MWVLRWSSRDITELCIRVSLVKWSDARTGQHDTTVPINSPHHTMPSSSHLTYIHLLATQLSYSRKKYEGKIWGKIQSIFLMHLIEFLKKYLWSFYFASSFYLSRIEIYFFNWKNIFCWLLRNDDQQSVILLIYAQSCPPDPSLLPLACPPLLHFPANLKHNKRPFYPQNKLTITQKSEVKFAKSTQIPWFHHPAWLEWSYLIFWAGIPVLWDDICVEYL